MCCHVFEDNVFVLILLTETGRAGAENKNLFPVSKDSNGFPHAKEYYSFHNTGLSDQAYPEQSWPNSWNVDSLFEDHYRDHSDQ